MPLIITYLTCSTFFFLSFFFNDTATTEIYTLSLHDALPICLLVAGEVIVQQPQEALVAAPLLDQRGDGLAHDLGDRPDRKSTRLNSSHVEISYAVFCLKKKNFEGLVPLTIGLILASTEERRA